MGCVCTAAVHTALVKARWEQLAEQRLSLQNRMTPPFAPSQPATYEPEGAVAWHTPAPTLMAVGAGPVQPADGKSAARGRRGRRRGQRREGGGGGGVVSGVMGGARNGGRRRRPCERARTDVDAPLLRGGEARQAHGDEGGEHCGAGKEGEGVRGRGQRVQPERPKGAWQNDAVNESSRHRLRCKERALRPEHRAPRELTSLHGEVGQTGGGRQRDEILVKEQGRRRSESVRAHSRV